MGRHMQRKVSFGKTDIIQAAVRAQLEADEGDDEDDEERKECSSTSQDACDALETDDNDEAILAMGACQKRAAYVSAGFTLGKDNCSMNLCLSGLLQRRRQGRKSAAPPEIVLKTATATADRSQQFPGGAEGEEGRRILLPRLLGSSLGRGGSTSLGKVASEEEPCSPKRPCLPSSEGRPAAAV